MNKVLMIALLHFIPSLVFCQMKNVNNEKTKINYYTLFNKDSLSINLTEKLQEEIYFTSVINNNIKSSINYFNDEDGLIINYFPRKDFFGLDSIFLLNGSGLHFQHLIVVSVVRNNSKLKNMSDIKELDSPNCFSYYPNPISSNRCLNIELSKSIQSCKVILYNMNGAIVYNSSFEECGQNIIKCDLTGIKAGIYLLRCDMKKSASVYKKLIIK